MKKKIKNDLLSDDFYDFTNQILAFPLVKMHRFDNLLKKISDKVGVAQKYVLELEDKLKSIPLSEPEKLKAELRPLSFQVTQLLNLFEQMTYESKRMDKVRSYLIYLEEEIYKLQRELNAIAKTPN